MLKEKIMSNTKIHKDLTGIWSGELEVLRRGTTKRSKRFAIRTWVCLCHRCGKIREIEERSLLNGTAKHAVVCGDAKI